MDQFVFGQQTRTFRKETPHHLVSNGGVEGKIATNLSFERINIKQN